MRTLRLVIRLLELAAWLLGIFVVRYTLWVPVMWLALRPLGAVIGLEAATAVILLSLFAVGHAVSFIIVEPRMAARFGSREAYDAQAALWGDRGGTRIHPRHAPRFEHAEHGPGTGGEEPPASVEHEGPGR